MSERIICSGNFPRLAPTFLRKPNIESLPPCPTLGWTSLVRHFLFNPDIPTFDIITRFTSRSRKECSEEWRRLNLHHFAGQIVIQMGIGF